MAPSRVGGRLTHSSSSSGIFFQGDGQSQTVVNSHLGSSFGNSPNSILTTGRPILGPVSGDGNLAMLNSVANSGPSVGASSLVTDANSALSGGPHLQRSASINTESYMRLPASPMSFSSNNISVSGSSVVDGSSGIQQGNHQDVNGQQVRQVQQQQRVSSATSLPKSENGQIGLPMGPLPPGSFLSDSTNISQAHKKQRLDIKQEDILQLLQRQDSMQMQGHNPQLQAIVQQQRMRQQQQIMQSMPQLQRTQLQQQQQQIIQSMPQLQRNHLQQQMQLTQQMQQQAVQPISAMQRPDSGICARRLMQYLYHQRQRPPDNSIAYWRKFVAEYYSPRAKKRWCLSLYDNVGHQATGVFPRAAMDAWKCDICGSKCGKGFEATFEVLPRLIEIKFGSGVIDELLYLDFPCEYRFMSGVMLLEYRKAVQESVYEQLRVVREGQLRVIFTQDLKILSWEFCARRHEELFPRRLVGPQVNQLLQVAQKCQITIAESGSDGVSQQDLQANSNMVLAAGRQLAKSMELQSLNDLGFSKRYVRCLQISEVVNSMKDLIDFCRGNEGGPIEGLKNYLEHASAARAQMQKMQEMEHLASAQGLPTDRNTLNKLMTLHTGVNNHHKIANNHQLVGPSGSTNAAVALTNYQNMLRQNSMNSVQHEASSSFKSSNQSPSPSFQGSMQKLNANGYSSAHMMPQQSQMQQLGGNAIMQHNNLQSSQNNQALQQQQMMQQLQQQYAVGQNLNMFSVRNGMGVGNNNNSAAAINVASRSNSFKAASNSNSPAGEGFNPQALEVAKSVHLGQEDDISHDFPENCYLNSDLDDGIGYPWKE